MNQCVCSCLIIIIISGKLYLYFLTEPVSDYVKATVETVIKIHSSEPLGDVLCFLTGQEEVERAVSLLKEHLSTLSADTGFFNFNFKCAAFNTHFHQMNYYDISFSQQGCWCCPCMAHFLMGSNLKYSASHPRAREKLSQLLILLRLLSQLLEQYMVCGNKWPGFIFNFVA